MKKAAPKWTMTSRKFYTHHELTPGPGAYSFQSTNSGQAASLDKSPRPGLVSAGTSSHPGPGAYSPNKPLPSLGNTLYHPHSFPKAARKDTATVKNVPGPGQYFSEPKPEGPQFSLRGRSQDSSVESKPGPCNYSPSYDYTLEKPPSYKLGTSKRTTSMVTSLVPGPGNYSLRSTVSGPTWGFGSSPRSTSYETSVPGPGAYSIKPHTDHISFSMTPRRPFNQVPDKTPGPGTYTYLAAGDLPKFTISKSKRQGMALESLSPGPGAYSPEAPKSQARNLCNSNIDSELPPGC